MIIVVRFESVRFFTCSKIKENHNDVRIENFRTFFIQIYPEAFDVLLECDEVKVRAAKHLSLLLSDFGCWQIFELNA